MQTLYPYLLLLLLLSTGLGCNSPETEENWISLFNGENTEGWRKYGGDALGEAWQVVEGELHLIPQQVEGWQSAQGGDIITEEVFESFHLSLEWKISQNGNSGIIFLIHEDTTLYPYPWMTGPEMQILDNEGHSDAQIPTHRAGDLYDLISVSQETVKPFGEWNLAEIICVNNELVFKLNGVQVVQTSLWDESWAQSIAQSKFKDMPGFGTFRKGHIGLQDHGDAVAFRNIKIKRL
jgi:hypothetical protein